MHSGILQDVREQKGERPRRRMCSCDIVQMFSLALGPEFSKVGGHLHERKGLCLDI